MGDANTHANDQKQGPSEPAHAAPPADRQRLFLTGGVIGSILASLCCLVPPVLLAFGATTAAAGAFAFFKPSRPYFVTLTLAILAASWCLAYRRRRQDCVAGSGCFERTSRPVPDNRLALWAVSALVLVMFALPAALGSLGHGPARLSGGAGLLVQPPAGGAERPVTLRVSGMTCGSCPLIVRQALDRVPGVESAEVMLEPPLAVVRLSDPGPSPEALVAAVQQAGYGAAVQKVQAGSEGR